MTKEKQAAVAAVEAKRDLVAQVADSIWDYAELSLQETRSAALYCEVLEKEGFTVEKGICNIATAFSASYGSGRPVIGILAEYDALSGLSQEGGSVERKERVSGGCGHGCGHNLLGAGAMAAALGVKAFLESTHTPGTVILYGCPGEEGGAAKAFMARDGLWKRLDAAITWHPEDTNEVQTGSSNSCIQTQYHFTGVPSHAAGAPDRGRSALDAVELMNIGVQFLREHMSDKARVHYAITDAGGRSPNVVQPKASVLYMVRSNHVAEAVELHQHLKGKAAREKAIEYLRDVGIPDPERRAKQYPHEFSGGMRQRVVIAIAVACNPQILICDEPTTALDVTIQAQILELLKEMRVKYNLTIVLITHDLGVVANIADRVAVMYAGDIVEIGTADEIYYDPRHPYTWALLSSMPQMGVKGEDLFNIQGTPPNLFAEIRGDAFAPRNPQALKIDFVKQPPYFTVSPTHRAKTWLLDPRAPKIEPPAVVQRLREEGI